MTNESSNKVIENDELLTYITILLSIFIIPLIYLNMNNTNIISLLLFISLLFIFICKNIQHSDKNDYNIKYDLYFYLRIILIIIILLHFFQYIYNVNTTINSKKTRGGGTIGNVRNFFGNLFRKNKIAPIKKNNSFVSNTFTESKKGTYNSNSETLVSFSTNASNGSIISNGDVDLDVSSNIQYTISDKNRPLSVERLSKFVKSLSNYSIDKRIKDYDEIKRYIDSPDFDSNNLVLNTIDDNTKELKIGKNILLLNIIGTESVFGIIYLTSIRGHNVVSKIMKKNYDNETEIYITKLITDYIINHKFSRHFVMMYSSYTFIDRERNEEMIVSINELANGDLKELLSIKNVLEHDNLLFNLLFQCFISIATFHNYTGYVHCDTHYGNFLYQNNNEEGYYKYAYKDKIYYLKSCKYNIMINDFGLSKKNSNSTLYYHKNIKDYMKIIYAFINKKYIKEQQVQDSSSSVKKNRCFTFFNCIRNVNNMSTNVSVQNASKQVYKDNYISKAFTEKMLDIIKIFTEIDIPKKVYDNVDIVEKIINDIFLKFGNKVMVTDISENDKIINIKPFIIGNKPYLTV